MIVESAWSKGVVPIADRSTSLQLCVWDGRSCVFGGWEACREGVGIEFLLLRVRDWLKVTVKLTSVGHMTEAVFSIEQQSVPQT